MDAGSDERWRAIVAALVSDDVRAVLAETAALPSPARRERAVARLERLGLIRRTADGVVFDSAPIAELLTAAPRRVGVERYLDGRGRIDRYPAKDEDRRSLLAWVAARVLAEDEVLTEAELNARLEPFAPGGDVAVLRRYLVDAELLERTRSGSEYARVSD